MMVNRNDLNMMITWYHLLSTINDHYRYISQHYHRCFGRFQLIYRHWHLESHSFRWHMIHMIHMIQMIQMIHMINIPLQIFPRADHDQMTWRCENWGWILHYCSPCVARWKHWKCNRRNYMFSQERNSEDAHDQLTWSSWLEERCESEYWVESDNAVPA